MKVEKGDVVRLAASVTLAEFGLALCDDDGEMLEIDGVVTEVKQQGLIVMIRRMMPMPAPFAWNEGSVSRYVRFSEVLGVISEPAHLWPTAGLLKGVSNERDGKAGKQAQPVMWSVGVEEMPL